MPEAQGVLNLCLPAVVLNTLLRRLITSRERPRSRPVELRNRLRELAGNAKVSASAPVPARYACIRASWPRSNPAVCSACPSRVTPRPSCASPACRSPEPGPVRMGEHRGARLEPIHATKPELQDTETQDAVH